ncbi:MAG: hypothetical protein LIP77_10750, partial [Planctomycetes bacterium]|nr:hypothetical protein [Planctomycetota bacterium]
MSCERHGGATVTGGWRTVVLAAVVLLASVAGPAAGGELTLAEADNRLAIAERLIQGGMYDRALEIAASILDAPEARAVTGTDADTLPWRQRREVARYFHDRSRLGLAVSRAEILDIAASFRQLAENRYRLPEPAYPILALYWAGRAFESVGEYELALEMFERVGGLSLPPGVEGDAAQRMARCLRLLAEDLPYPGNARERQERGQLLTQAIGELDRARLAFPVGNRRKEIELDLIALRLARRQPQYIREAITEAEAFIESDPAKDELRARAVLYRGQAAALLGSSEEAVAWFGRVLQDEAPADADRRAAELGLALALVEQSRYAGGPERERLVVDAAAALGQAVAGTMSPGPMDGARILRAQLLLELDHPAAALASLEPILEDESIHPAAWRVSGLAEMGRGRLDEALGFLYPATRPSNPDGSLRLAASREAARAAEGRRDYGLALALDHHASRLLRRERLFSTLLVAEFQALEVILRLGRMGGPVSLSSDIDLLMADAGAVVVPVEHWRERTTRDVAGSLGLLLAGGGNPDSAYDLAIAAEAAYAWHSDPIADLELAIAMIAHLRQRQPTGVTDRVLASRLGEARHALALVRAERILAAEEPAEGDIALALDGFAQAAAAFQEAAAGGFSVADSLNQGMVSMESGAFLLRLADRWERGVWSPLAGRWRTEARQRIEASVRPFNDAIATSTPSGQAARRARWSRGRALELLGEWRAAAADYLSLMNNSELARVLRANAARRWAECM